MQDGQTALFQACETGHSNVVKVLLHYGANVNQLNDVSKADSKLVYLSDYGRKPIYLMHNNILLSHVACSAPQGVIK